jgi:hypothetical protein
MEYPKEVAFLKIEDKNKQMQSKVLQANWQERNFPAPVGCVNDSVKNSYI